MKSLSHDNAGAERSFVFVLRSFTVANMFVLEESNNQRKFNQSHCPRCVESCSNVKKHFIGIKIIATVSQAVLEHGVWNFSAQARSCGKFFFFSKLRRSNCLGLRKRTAKLISQHAPNIAVISKVLHFRLALRNNQRETLQNLSRRRLVATISHRDTLGKQRATLTRYFMRSTDTNKSENFTVYRAWTAHFLATHKFRGMATTKCDTRGDARRANKVLGATQKWTKIFITPREEIRIHVQRNTTKFCLIFTENTKKQRAWETSCAIPQNAEHREAGKIKLKN